MISTADVTEINTALALAQAELENATKSSTNPHFRSKYADLTACLDTVRPTFAKHGLAIVQGIEGATDGNISVVTRLLHKSGQWFETTLVIPLGKRDAQGVGAAATYGRRYALAAIAGLGQEDDDGNAASGLSSKKLAAKTTELDPWIAKFDAAKTKADIEALAKEFTGLSQEMQAKLLPLAKAARTRCGL